MTKTFSTRWLCFFLFIFFVATSYLSAQQKIDTQVIRNLIDSAWNIRYEQPEKSLALSKRALALSGDSYYDGQINAVQLHGESYFGLGKMDSALFWFHKALWISQLKEDDYETGNNYSSLATVYFSIGIRDSSLYYYNQAISIFSTLSDSSSLGDALLRYGNVHNDMGNHELAIKAYLESVRICEAINKTAYIGYNYGAIGTVHDKQGNYEQAEEYFLKALEIFQSVDDWYGQMGVYNNLGVLYKNQSKFDASLQAYNQSLIFADSIRFTRGQISGHTNLGILNTLLDKFELALYHLDKSLKLSYQFEAKESIADNLNWMARAQSRLGQFSDALDNARLALTFGAEVESLERQRDASLTLSEIYAAQKSFELSLDAYKDYVTFKDSLFNIDKSKQMDELMTLYETEKKDNEIALLEKKSEIDQIKKTRLWISFGLSLLVGGLIIYNLRVKRTRERKILSQEKELEVQRRQTAELKTEKVTRELDFKKQELVAKALQLARKNEFLLSVQEQVQDIRNDKASTVEDSTRRITRQIRRDIASEEEWEQFLASFREVHRDFMDALQQAFPNLTKGEIRLACLMKMNLTGKELLAMLNISQEGIKKARHRMRKKLDLSPEIDIQEFLLSFPS